MSLHSPPLQHRERLKFGRCETVARMIEKLDLHILRQADGILNIDTQIANGALQFAVAKQKLAGAQIAGFL